MTSIGFVGAGENVIDCLENSMKGWRMHLIKTALGSVYINRGIFQGDSLSPLVFIVTLIPMTIVFGKDKPTISGKIFGTKWSNPIKLDRKRKV